MARFGGQLGGLWGALGCQLGCFGGIVFDIIFEPPPEPVWDPFGAPKVAQNGFQIAPKGVRSAKCGIIKNVKNKLCFFCYFQASRPFEEGFESSFLETSLPRGLSRRKKCPRRPDLGPSWPPQTDPRSLPKRSKFKSNFQSKFGTAPEGHLERKMGRDGPKSPTGRGWGSPWRGVGGRSPPFFEVWKILEVRSKESGF